MDERLAANRANWDDRTPVHVESDFYDVEGWLRDARGPRAHEADALGDVTGLRLLHLQCHFGLDTLAWARAGAEVTGLDFSEVAIDAARDVARRAGREKRATFVCGDVLDAAEVLEHQTFDIVYVSLGALCWLPSVDRWASQVGALVAPGGRFFLHESHPVAWSLADDDLRWEHTYFEEAEPFVWDSDESYTGGERLAQHHRTYEWNHSLGETLSALIRHGLQLDWLTEHDWTAHARYPWLIRVDDQRWELPTDRPRVPLSYSLLAHRPNEPLGQQAP